MVKSQPSDLHQSIKIAPHDRLKRGHHNISFVRLLIDVSNSQMGL